MLSCIGGSKRGVEREHCPGGIGISRLFSSSSAMLWMVLVLLIGLALLALHQPAIDQSETMWLFYTAVPFFAITVGIIACWLGLRARHTLGRKLSSSQEALRESEERLRHLSSQLISAQERERKQIARELHDSVGQSLSAIKFAIENSLKTLSAHAGTAELSEALKPLQALVPVVRQAIDEIRRIYMELRPSILDDLGIIATISWFCRQFQTIYSGMHVEKRVELGEEDVPEQLKIVIFRIMQEALHNASKYSQADLVTVCLAKREGAIELTIEDNGEGFDVDWMLSMDSCRKGLGLASMKERTELSGGRFSITSCAGKGTTVRSTWNVRESGESNSPPKDAIAPR